MSRNKPAEPIWIANIITVWGGKDIFMGEEEARNYNADPDAYAAAHFKLTKIEYLNWLDAEGGPRCAHRTAGGDLCRNTTGGYQLDAAEWKHRHRKFLCAVHQKTKPRRK